MVEVSLDLRFNEYMKIYLGADHRGFKFKEIVKQQLKVDGYEVVDVGAEVILPEDDYFDYGQEVASQVERDAESRGVLLCGSGHGMDMVANRFAGVRGILGFNFDVVIQGRQDEDANILILPADWLSEDEVKDMVKVFLETPFSHAGRHVRRLEKLAGLRR